jgi:hypothetical protein
LNGKKTGIHATPKKNVDKILSRGLRKIPFWQSRVPIRKPFEFRFAYLPFSNVVSGKTKAERTDAIFDALKAANIHLTGSSRNKFQIRRIGLILVDLGKARIHKSETRIMKGSKGIPKKVEYTGEKLDEILLTSPPEALTQVKNG